MKFLTKVILSCMVSAMLLASVAMANVEPTSDVTVGVAPESTAEETTVAEETLPAVVVEETTSAEIKIIEVDSETTVEETTEETTEAETEPETVPEENWVSLGVFKVTAYCPCRKCNGNNRKVARDGTPLVPYWTIATDWNVIPKGTKIRIGDHVWETHDTGNGIRGNRIDLCYPTHQAAPDWGIRKCEVFVRQ